MKKVGKLTVFVGSIFMYYVRVPTFCYFFIEKDELPFLVTKETKSKNGDIVKQDMFLTITDDEIKEKDTNYGRTITKWSLSSLQSCTQVSHNKLHLIFDTIRRDKKESLYEIESEFSKLYKHLTDILDSRSLSEMNQTVFKCMKCSLQFSHELKVGRLGKLVLSSWVKFLNINNMLSGYRC